MISVIIFLFHQHIWNVIHLLDVEYLQEIVEALLFYLLPDEEFDQTMFRFLVREVLVQGVIAPTIEKMSDPDYMNQNMIWMVRVLKSLNQM